MGLNWDNLGWGLAQWGKTLGDIADRRAQRRKEEAVANTIGDMIKMQDYETGDQDQFKAEQIVGMPSMDLFEGGIPDPSDTTKIGDMTGYTPDHEGYVQDYFEKIMKNLQMTDPQSFVQLASQITKAKESAMSKIQEDQSLKTQYEYMLKTVSDNPDLFADNFVKALEGIDPNDLRSYLPTIEALYATTMDLLKKASEGRASAKQEEEGMFSESGKRVREQKKQDKLDYLKESAKIQEEIDNRKRERQNQINSAKETGEGMLNATISEGEYVEEMVKSYKDATDKATEFGQDLALGLQEGDLNEYLATDFVVESGSHTYTNNKTGEPYKGFEFNMYEFISRLDEFNNNNDLDSKSVWSDEEIVQVIDLLGKEKLGETTHVNREWIADKVMPMVREVIKSPANIITMQNYIDHQQKAKKSLVQAVGSAIGFARAYPEMRSRWENAVQEAEAEGDDGLVQKLYNQGREMQLTYERLVNSLIIDELIVKGKKSGKVTINPKILQNLPPGVSASDITESIMQEYGSGIFDSSTSYLTPERDVGGRVPVTAEEMQDNKVDEANRMLLTVGMGGEEEVTVEEVFRYEEPTQGDRYNKGQYKQSMRELEGLMPQIVSGVQTLFTMIEEDIADDGLAIVDYVPRGGDQEVSVEINGKDPLKYREAMQFAIADYVRQITGGKEYNINVNRPPFQEVNRMLAEWYKKTFRRKKKATQKPTEKDESSFISPIDAGRYSVTGEE